MATYQPSKEIYKKQLNIMLDILAKQSEQLHSLLTANVNKVTATAREWTEQSEHDMTFNDMVSLITAASTSVLFSTEVIQGIDAGKSIQQQSDQAEGNDPEKIHRVSTVVRGASTKVSSTTVNLRPITRQSVAAVAPWSTLPTGPTGPDPIRELDRTFPATDRPSMTGQPDRNILQSKQFAVIQDRLTASMLAAVPPFEQKQMLGEKLFPPIQRMYPELAGKITGMLLEIDNAEILHMLESVGALKLKVEEAVAVLQAHQAIPLPI